jgi:drug/metabolite transporter (DMT)-like permease
MASSISQGAYAPGRQEATPRPGVWLTEVALFAMAVIWGVNFSVVKFGTRFLRPLAFNGLRVAIATAVLLVLALTQRRTLPSRRDVVGLAALGLVGHGAYQTLFILGLARTTAGVTALVLAASPALIAIVGTLLGVERPTGRAWLGVALQLLGVGLVTFASGAAAGHGAGGGRPTTAGPLILLAAALCWAFYAVLLKRYTERVHPLQISAWTMAGGVLLLGAIASPALAATHWRAVPLPGWGAVAYSGFGALVIAYLFYYRGVRVLGPTRTAMFSNLQPLIALTVAYLTLGETPSVWQLAGAGSIMTGLLVSRR